MDRSLGMVATLQAATLGTGPGERTRLSCRGIRKLPQLRDSQSGRSGPAHHSREEVDREMRSLGTHVGDLYRACFFAPGDPFEVLR